jgi:chemotaxis protein MotB
MSSHKRRSRHEAHEEGPSAERWLLTYSDMITLLMVLFIVLFALGQTDIRKFNAFKDSFHLLTNPTQPSAEPPGGPGVLSQPSAIAVIEQNPFARLDAAAANSVGGMTQVGQDHSGHQISGVQSAGQATAAEHQALVAAEQQMKAALAKLHLQGDVSFSFDQRGLIVSILTDQIIFPVDSAQLQPEGRVIVNALAPVLAMLPNEVDVEGNTDNQPIIGGPYRDNWELSSARAVAVVEDLIAHQVAPARLQATGNSDTRPLVPNNNAAHQSENRRVEIVVFSTTDVTP